MAEAAKIEAERKEAERIERERLAKIAAEKKEAERVERERLAKIETENKEAKRIEQKRLAKIAAEKHRKDYAEIQKGFGSMVDVSYCMDFKYPYPSVGLTYTAGYRFNNHLYLGAGVGANINIGGGTYTYSKPNLRYYSYLAPCKVSVPLFVYFRANFLNRRCSPFFALAAGGNLSAKRTLHLDLVDVEYDTNGLFVNPQLGVNFRTTTKTSLYFALGFQCFTVPTDYCYNTGYSIVFTKLPAFGLDFHLGFTF